MTTAVTPAGIAGVLTGVAAALRKRYGHRPGMVRLHLVALRSVVISIAHEGRDSIQALAVTDAALDELQAYLCDAGAHPGRREHGAIRQWLASTPPLLIADALERAAACHTNRAAHNAHR